MSGPSDPRGAGDQGEHREACEHGVTLGFACNDCSVRAGRTVGVTQESAPCEAVDRPRFGGKLFICTLPTGHDGTHLDEKQHRYTWTAEPSQTAPSVLADGAA